MRGREYYNVVFGRSERSCPSQASMWYFRDFKFKSSLHMVLMVQRHLTRAFRRADEENLRNSNITKSTNAVEELYQYTYNVVAQLQIHFPISS